MFSVFHHDITSKTWYVHTCKLHMFAYSKLMKTSRRDDFIIKFLLNPNCNIFFNREIYRTICNVQFLGKYFGELRFCEEKKIAEKNIWQNVTQICKDIASYWQKWVTLKRIAHHGDCNGTRFGAIYGERRASIQPFSTTNITFSLVTT